jgi:hypothetical protein
VTDKRKQGFAVTGLAKEAGHKGGLKSKGRTLTPEHKQKLREAYLKRKNNE